MLRRDGAEHILVLKDATALTGRKGKGVVRVEIWCSGRTREMF